MEDYIFISYSNNDKQIADAICHFLEENGIACWIAPRDILPGETWAGAIVKAIRGCAAMVLVYSKNSNSSTQVANEVDKAFSNNKTIIPFMMDSTPLNDDFEYYLSRKHWLVAYPDYRQTFAPLLSAVLKIVPQSEVTKPAEEESTVEEPRQPETPEPPAQTAGMPLSPVWSPEATELQKKTILAILANMVLVEGGEMELGATKEQLKWADKDEKPAHMVELSSYYICKFTVTQEEWENITGLNPAKHNGRFKPVERVSLITCREFVKKLQELSNIAFALPTEAQWEYAARGGNKSQGYVYAGSDNLAEVGWKMWDDGETHEVGQKKPNELGLYDMSGNVFEWCDEIKGRYTADRVVNPHNCYKPGFWDIGYIQRGGDHLSTKNCRVSYRSAQDEKYISDTIGLRLVINI